MKNKLIKLINLYQRTPLHSHYGCKFIPTCSEYAKESIETYGAFKGSILSIKGILRCHPFRKVSVDMVPKKEKK